MITDAQWMDFEERLAHVLQAAEREGDARRDVHEAKKKEDNVAEIETAQLALRSAAATRKGTVTQLRGLLEDLVEQEARGLTTSFNQELERRFAAFRAELRDEIQRTGSIAA